MDYHLNEAEEGRAKESLMVLRDMVMSRCAVNRGNVVRNAVLPPPIPCTSALSVLPGMVDH
ncbi:hypothetical protein KCP77_13820 [Salmonella enterica subsp. enterica]|nr:hypothetical protein KCP77_13820 [Salmonella enterica subsp. enterica]